MIETDREEFDKLYVYDDAHFVCLLEVQSAIIFVQNTVE